MAATLAQQTALGSDQGFINRVQAAMLAQALVVEGEGAVPNHATRLVLANKVLSAPQGYAAQFAQLLPCGTNATQVAIGTAYASTNPPHQSRPAAGWALGHRGAPGRHL